MRTTAQILAAVDAVAGSARSLPELLCDDCATHLGLVGAGIALMNDTGHQGVVGASDALTARLEELQFELGEGPGLDASRDNAPILRSDLGARGSATWPVFGPVAVAAGVSAVFALPLQVGAVRLGSLCLYRSAPGSLGVEGTATALAYADAATEVLLRLHAEVAPGSSLHSDLGDMLRLRAEVHQATGFVSVQASVGITEALLLLRAHAFAADRPLLDVARDVLSGRLRIPLQEGEDG
ncbi:GAF domain-containing protein [Nocardioides panacihumi]|uniref:GAF domain-containing protein n=1 Tax=Nocardioides panacihumi TaxID=400774 RepID=A0ABP5C382_9ACTN